MNIFEVLGFLILVIVSFSVAFPSAGPKDFKGSSQRRRARRQASDSVCDVNTDCLPNDLQNPPISEDLARCAGGICECNDCLMFNPDTQKCFTCVDYPYNVTTNSCGTDVRQDQRRAFVLSLFLSSTGAANFYIESYGLAVGQLVVLIVFIVSIIILICPCCICCGCISKEGAIKGTCLFLVLFILAIVFAIAMGLLIVSWWVGELTIFANNERMTGNGCFPRPNL